MENYKIKTENFEGPLDLLLELIEKRKLDITRISISKVADDFLSFIENNSNINLVNLSEFLVIASQLILIKSKALLPLFEFTEKEEEEIVDLEKKLLEYRKVKEISVRLGELFSSSKSSFSRKEEKEINFNKFVDPGIEKDYLLKIYKKVINEIPQEEKIAEKVMEKVISMEEKMIELKKTIGKRMKIAFSETIKNASEKVDIIVTFLAMLEMIKQKTIEVEQEKIFGDILLIAKKDD